MLDQSYRSLPRESFLTARKKLLEIINPVSTIEVSLEEAIGKISAQDYFAKINVPHFAKSAFDGFALRSCDLKNATPDNPITFKIIGEAKAGVPCCLALNKNEAVKILTGAPIPQNCDCVIMHEKTHFTEHEVTVYESLKAQQNIIQIGEDQKIDQKLISSGSRLEAPEIGLLASQGYKSVLVYKNLTIGIISTGDELIELEEKLEDGKIYNTNRYLLTSELKKLGFNIKFIAHAKDQVDEISCAIDESRVSCDVIILTGGVSAGDYDLVPDAMIKSGFKILTYGVKLKPGMACCYGFKDQKLCIALSGNPASAMTNFYAIAKPLLLKLAGEQKPEPQSFNVKVLKDFNKKAKHERLLRGKLVILDGVACMDLNVEQGNVVISSMVDTNLLAIVPPEHGQVKKGDLLEAFFI